jgi:hypothetical protein
MCLCGEKFALNPRLSANFCKAKILCDLVKKIFVNFVVRCALCAPHLLFRLKVIASQLSRKMQLHLFFEIHCTHD